MLQISQRTGGVFSIPGYPQTMYYCRTVSNLKEAQNCSLGWTKQILVACEVPLGKQAETQAGMIALLASHRLWFETTWFFQHFPATVKGPELVLLTIKYSKKS